MARRVGQAPLARKPSEAADDLSRIVRRTKVTRRLRSLLARLWRRWRGTGEAPWWPFAPRGTSTR
jgi:hypothetical protein